MDLSANICACCCMVHTKASLTQFTRSQEEFLHPFLSQDSVTSLSICNPCKSRLGDFQQFCGQIKRNIEMLETIKSEQARTEQAVQPDSTCSPQENMNDLRDLSVISDSSSYINKRNPDGERIVAEPSNDCIMSNPRQKTLKEQRRLPHPTHFIFNQITIEEAAFATNSPVSEAGGIDVTPDVSIVLNPGENVMNTNILEEPVSPPPSTETISTSSFVNELGVPIFVPTVKKIIENKDPALKSMRPLNSDERRKHRNREASRRYRERARGDPELLKKMREQQNARQKKYYARLRMKKMNSGEWNEDAEDDSQKY